MPWWNRRPRRWQRAQRDLGVDAGRLAHVFCRAVGVPLVLGPHERLGICRRLSGEPGAVACNAGARVCAGREFAQGMAGELLHLCHPRHIDARVHHRLVADAADRSRDQRGAFTPGCGRSVGGRTRRKKRRQAGLAMATAIPVPQIVLNVALGLVASFSLYMAPVYFLGHWNARGQHLRRRIRRLLRRLVFLLVPHPAGGLTRQSGFNEQLDCQPRWQVNPRGHVDPPMCRSFRSRAFHGFLVCGRKGA